MKKYMDTSLSFEERVDALMNEMTLKEKLMIMVETSRANERLGIPKYHHGNEALHGLVRPGKTTVFPQAIAFGATFDTKLLHDIADAISDETRAMHHHGCGTLVDEQTYNGLYNGLLTFWSPDLNLCRDPRWGRTSETYGEDPYLAGQMGIAFVKGLQGNHPKYLKAVSTPKHFTANNEEHNRFSCNAKMTEKDFREYHLAPFKMAVEEGHCEAVMAAYNAINGKPCHSNHRLLTEILREEWGFNGYTVSDCSGISRLWDNHHQFDEPEDAAAGAVNAGIDLECGGYSKYEHFYLEFLEKAVEEGKVREERIDEACRRVLTARFKLGQFDSDEDVPFSKIPLSVIGCPKHVKLAYQCAVESSVLLKNNGILPFSFNKKIAVVGNNAPLCQFGDYSGKPLHPPISPLEGMQKIGKDNIVYAAWTDADRTDYSAVKSEYLMTEDGQKGINGEYYPVTGLMGKCKTRTDSEIDFAWLGQMPDELIETTNFSIRWNGYLMPKIDGKYKLRLTWNGSAKCEPPKMIINGKECGTSAELDFKAGDKISVTVEYIKTSENPEIHFEWIIPESMEDKYAKAVEAAKISDCVVAVIGLGKEFEHEGHDKETLDLPEEQVELIRRIYKVNKNIVTVVLNGSPVSICEIHDLSAAVVEAWYPGEQGGNAIASLLYGIENFSGRLNCSFPKSEKDIPAFDDYVMSHGRTYMYNKIEPLYPFGFGLSYTKFAYENLKIYEKDRKYYITVKLKNIGYKVGEEVTQIYLDSAGIENQPMYRLVKFGRTLLQPNEETVLYYELTDKDFILFNIEGEEKQYSGEYTLYVGGSLPNQRSQNLGAGNFVFGKILR